jgi:gluconate 5-dehydrogenase
VETAVARLRRENKAAWSLVADVADRDAVTVGMARLADAGTVPDVLINNVGIRDRRGMQDMNTNDFRALVEVNLVAAYDLTKQFADALVRQSRGGVIVNVSSLLGQRARADDVAYSAAKAGLNGLTRALAVELGFLGFRANSVAPGAIATETNERLVNDATVARWIKTLTRLGRWGAPEEIGPVVAFLASGASSYITGQTIVVCRRPDLQRPRDRDLGIGHDTWAVCRWRATSPGCSPVVRSTSGQIKPASRRCARQPRRAIPFTRSSTLVEPRATRYVRRCVLQAAIPTESG